MKLKSTGIIRRIDDLGRIVIPKEIRRTLRLREGDPMEIYLQDGGVLFQKYSPLGELGNFAQNFVDSLFETTGYIALICDRDNVIAVAGISKKEFLNKPIWDLAQQAMEERNTKVGYSAIAKEEFKYQSQVVTPIFHEGDVIGVVGLISKQENMESAEQKLVEIVARTLAKHMES